MLSSHQGYSIIRLLSYQRPQATAGDISVHLTQSQRQCSHARSTFKTAVQYYDSHSHTVYQWHPASILEMRQRVQASLLFPGGEYGSIWYLNGSNCSDLFML